MNRPSFRYQGQSAGTLSLLAAWSWLTGCQPQVTTDYRGDSLFSMAGRVELQLTEAPDDSLIPALAFMAPEEDEVRFVEPQVNGEFPAQFQLDLYDPPPQSVIGGLEYEDIPGEPHTTLGFITAVRPDHLPALYFAGVLAGGDERCVETGCYNTMTAKSFDAEHVGTVTLFCPGSSADNPAPITDCEVSSRTGDPMFVTPGKDRMFAGAADNYAVAYLDGDAKPGSVAAARLGATGGLSAGYHLLEILPADPAAEPAKQECRDAAKADAVANYNAAHGTDLSEFDIIVQGCTEAGCEQFGPHTRALRGEWYRLMAERDCTIGFPFRPASDPKGTTVSLKVQPGITFMHAVVGGL